MVVFRGTYRGAFNSSHFFRVEIRRNGSTFDIYFISKPRLRGRTNDVSKHHIYSSGKVCFVDGQEPTTLSEAKQYVSIVADHYSRYIDTGKYKD